MGDAAKPDTRLLTHATTIPKPVIAAINGPAAGLGLALACSCDFRFCSKQAKLTSAFSKLGLIAEHGLSWALPHMMGTGNAMMMLMSSDVVTGRPVLACYPCILFSPECNFTSGGSSLKCNPFKRSLGDHRSSG